ncbi:MAG: asparagine synthase (glutamine-hydrolyzing) [Flavobacteriales bacterium]|jgi:asparagine synthase (glutamine-hydrolysing)
MCGILGVIGTVGQEANVSDTEAIRMRDTMTHRGPDGAGLERLGNAVLGHRRLAIRDLVNGQQPARSADGRWWLVYNGELYNDADLREKLRKRGVSFQTRCDTETLVEAIAAWDVDAIPMLQGMYAFGAYDTHTGRVVLARDPLGIKPLFFADCGGCLTFASEPRAILEHPRFERRPNISVVSSYLSTLRTTLGHETLFEGLYTLQPGEIAVADARVDPTDLHVTRWWQDPDPEPMSFSEARERTFEVVSASVPRHLVADVPTCFLLSGGIDSAILAAEGVPYLNERVHTWCASDPSDCGGDAYHAKLMAKELNSVHHNVTVESASFATTCDELIAKTAMPLSTPNQVAILAVARGLRAQATVAMSGEGADELFGGYAAPLLSGMDAVFSQTGLASPGVERYRKELVAQYGTAALGTELEHYLRCTSWVHPSQKHSVLTHDASLGANGDTALLVDIDDTLRAFAHLPPGERLLRLHRRINLTGLLGRLDACTMLASVEGRVPFADATVAEEAMRIPLEHKLLLRGAADGGRSSGQKLMSEGRVTSKAVLREAWRGRLPLVISERPKVSFPLPFEEWIAQLPTPEGPTVDALFRPAAIARLGRGAAWQQSWPLWNIARWAQRWFDGIDDTWSP